MKICKDCNIEKPLESFEFRKDQNKYRLYCKACQIIRRASGRAKYLANTKEHRALVGKQYRQKNKDKIRESSRIYNVKNKEAIRAKNKIYQENNKEKMSKIRNEYRRNKIKTDAVYCMKLRIRANINASLRAKGFKKTSSSAKILGCSMDFFKQHIENQFLLGMTWENRNLWHLDHIAPASLAASVEELEILNHYTNLRPLWGIENEIKSNTLTPEALQSINNLEKLFNMVFLNK